MNSNVGMKFWRRRNSQKKKATNDSDDQNTTKRLLKTMNIQNDNLKGGGIKNLICIHKKMFENY